MREVRTLHSFFLFLVSGLFAFVASTRIAEAATLTVCASGCAYTDLQDAINDAQPGDTILLRAGETFVGNFVLPNKPNSTGAYITIKSDAPASALPPAGTRLVPPGRTGANVTASALARLKGQGGHYKSIPVLQSAVGAHHYRLQFLDIDGVAQEGWYTLVSFGTNGSSQTTLSSVPYAITLDRVYVHGDPKKGQKRCITMNGRSLEVLNSYVANCGSFDADAQAIIGFNGPGPLRIINNYLEGTGETIMFGGADPAISNLVPSDIEIKGNHITKQLAWKNPILSPPSAAPSASVVSGGGSLASGTHYFKVVALIDAQNTVAVSAPSAERSVSVSSGAAVKLSWNAVNGATRYRIYRGTSAGGENRYLTTASATTSFTYTGSSESSGTPPTAGTKWVIKNLIELKNAQRVTIDGNILEHVWSAAQGGVAVVLSPRNQDGNAPWSAVRDVTISNNIIRHAGSAIAVTGHDTNHTSQTTERVTVRNNLVYDIGSAWGGAGRFISLRLSPSTVTLDHNTAFHERSIVFADEGTISGFRMTNNVAPHGPYGVFGTAAGSGTTALTKYFPGWVFTANGIGGADPSKYPSGNSYPDMATFLAQFVNAAAYDYRLVSTSVFRGKGTDGKDLGVDFAALQAAQGSGATTDPPSTPPPSTAGPYGGTPVSLPGTIQGENFDEGSAGVVYVDSTPGNAGSKYRNTDVDIESSGDSGGGYNIGWITPGEWLTYTVNVGTAGTYDLEFRLASAGGGGAFHLEVNGSDKTGAMSIPNTGGWQTWTTVRKTGVSLAAGQQKFRFVVDRAGSSGATANLNFMRLVSAAGGSTPPPPTTTAADIVLYASDVSRTAGNWAKVSYASGAGGQAMQSTDRGWSTADLPKAAPADYFEMTFTPEAGRAYRLWLRLRAQADSKWNESVWVQFSGAVDASGNRLWPVGSTSALLVNLEDCSGCGVSAWGWQNSAYWKSDPTVVRFASSTQQTIRIQTREDGALIDQVVLSPVNYYDRAPGSLKSDGTIVAKSAPMSPPSTESDIVLRSSDVTRLAGNWARVSSSTAAGGEKLASVDRGWSTANAPIASPGNYFETQFTPEAGKAYHVWLRLRASGNSKWNDSVWVQFSGAVTSSGAALWRTGTTNALLVNLENCSACGVSEWGWQDGAYWLQQQAVVRFASATTQTIRVQTREDGVEVDQIVLSPVTYFNDAPGPVKQDGTIVPR